MTLFVWVALVPALWPADYVYRLTGGSVVMALAAFIATWAGVSGGLTAGFGWLCDTPPLLPAPILEDFLAERREGSAQFATHEELAAAGLVDEL